MRRRPRSPAEPGMLEKAHHRACCVLACLLLASPPAVAGAEAGPLDRDEKPSGLQLEIAEALRGEASPDAEDRADPSTRLAALGSRAIPELFDVLVQRSFIVLGEEGEAERVPLSTPQESAILEALRQLPPAHVRDHLHSVARVDAPAAVRRLVVRLLAGVGRKEDLPLLVYLTNPTNGERRVELSRREPFREAFLGILERDPWAPREVEESYDAAHPSLLAPIVRAVGRQDSLDGLEHLALLLGHTPEADPLILFEMARLGDLLPGPYSPDTLAAVRRYLGVSDPELLLLAMNTTGRLGDRDAVPTLIDLCEHPVRAVGNEAVEALVLATGQNIGRSARRWEEWYLKTMEWWQYEAPAQLAELRAGDPGEVAHNLLELSKRRFFRHEMADDIAACLDRKEKDLVVMGCAVLGHLGSWKGVRPLVACLDDPDPQVQEAALRALRRITGQAFGGDPAAWRELAAKQP